MSTYIPDISSLAFSRRVVFLVVGLLAAASTL